ncbi:MAG: hypothetical protein K2L11_04895, partial [Muribaculaceae bacterium]|nr:hypothetical protein [Muribaculaceae bacterium]
CTRKQSAQRLARCAPHRMSGAVAVGGERSPSTTGWMGKEGAQRGSAAGYRPAGDADGADGTRIYKVLSLKRHIGDLALR